MVNIDPKRLCLALLRADTEDEVIRILLQANLWDDNDNWRPLGDNPNNYSSVGNQQSRAEQAVIEKLINAIDSKLIAECKVRGIDPKSAHAPVSMGKARQQFFGEALKNTEKLSRSICVCATGGRTRPSFTIVDDGEGQSPRSMHNTILSLHAGNKQRICFVQGKFNMGGTGVLEFCGKERNVQLVLSKRRPDLLDGSDACADKWSFTIIRRDDPETEGSTSKFVYLAPVRAEGNNGFLPFEDSKEGELLSFNADTMPIFPERNEAYAREAEWGTLFKLYEYEARRFRGHIMRGGGLLERVRVLLPEPALPIRLHECRTGYRGGKSSFDISMVGLMRTLLDDYYHNSRDNVEWYNKQDIYVEGEKFTTHLFLFKNKMAADNYRKDEGVVFSYNGQSHATLTKDFFRRKSVKQDYLWHSLLMIVDCSVIRNRAHEDLFMNSRDRLRDKKLKQKLEENLEDMVAKHRELRELANERRRREIASKTANSKKIADIIGKLVVNNPDIAKLLGMGGRIRDPHKPLTGNGGGGEASFSGQRFPYYFRFPGKEAGFELVRNAHLNTNCRIEFETNAENEYFRREEEPGQFELYIRSDSEWQLAQNFQTPNLYNGIAHLTFSLPEDAQIGDEIELKASLMDASRVDAIENFFRLNIKQEIKSSSSPTGNRKGNIDNMSSGTDGAANDRKKQQPSYLDPPQPVFVEKAEWDKHDPPFNKYTALRLQRKPGSEQYDYLINDDNIFLQNFLANRSSEASKQKLKFQMALVFVGLSILHQRQLMDEKHHSEDFPDVEVNVADFAQAASSAIASVLLPMIESVAGLEDDQEDLSDSAGETA